MVQFFKKRNTDFFRNIFLVQLNFRFHKLNWNSYFPQNQYKQNIKAEEKSFRSRIYLENCASINENNAKYEAGEVSFEMGPNKNMAKTAKERKARNGFKVPAKYLEINLIKI
jgi:hypothetical protein